MRRQGYYTSHMYAMLLANQFFCRNTVVASNSCDDRICLSFKSKAFTMKIRYDVMTGCLE